MEHNDFILENPTTMIGSTNVGIKPNNVMSSLSSNQQEIKNENSSISDSMKSSEFVVDGNTPVNNKNFSKVDTSVDVYKLSQGEEEMAEVDTGMLASQHADIRREAAEHASEIRYDVATRAGDIRHEIAAGVDQVADIALEQAGNIRREAQAGFGQTRYDTAIGVNEVIKESIKGDWHNSDAIKDSRFDLATRVGDAADRVVDRVVGGHAELTDRFFTVARDTADLRAQVIQAIDTTKMATELNALKGIIEGQKNTAYLADKIGAEGEKTRGLINELKYHDLSRGLIERNNELVEERNWGRHWYHGANQAQFGQQFAQLQSQMQNFNSQLSETRQGMVNFGTMAGVGQTSSANNVR